MGTPYPLLLIIAVYLYVVLKAGPKFMENRKAFNLNNVTRVYNLFQIILCTYGVLKAPHMGLFFKYGWKCVPLPKATDEITSQMLDYYNHYWFFILLRTSEFAETIFFVLRKKQNQVSLLHVYHHIAVVGLLWMFLKYSGSITEGFIGLLNTSVHSIMYSYYFLSSFNSLKIFTVLVKRLITTIQIVQLMTLLGHCVRSVITCEVSKLYYLQAANLSFLVVMFMQFYVKSYLKNKRTKKA